jgi:AcrR family transcriptional regulator
MPKVVDPEEQRRSIRDAARRVFAEHGVEGTGLVHVAAEAGVGRSSLYHYYRDKEALIRDLTGDLLDREEAMFMRRLGGGEAPLQRVEALMDDLVGTFSAWAKLGPLLFDLRRLDEARFRRFYRSVRRHLAAAIEEGQRNKDIDRRLDANAAAAAIVGQVDGVLLQKLLDSRAFVDGTALRRTLLLLVEKGLAA